MFRDSRTWIQKTPKFLKKIKFASSKEIESDDLLLRVGRGSVLMRAGAFIAVVVAASAIVSVYIFGPMGQRCSTPTVASVLEAVNSAQGAEEQDHDHDDDEVERKLLSYGIDISESDAGARRQCLNVVEQDRFWSNFAHLHPNHKRVKVRTMDR